MATAELAVAMPAVAVVLLAALTALGACVDQVRCVDAARAGARVMARGDGAPRAMAVARRAAPRGSAVAVAVGDGSVEVTVRAPAVPGLRWLGLTVQPASSAVADLETAAGPGTDLGGDDRGRQ